MKVLTVLSARPQFIKAATVSRAIREHNKSNDPLIEEVIINTGQHYDAIESSQMNSTNAKQCLSMLMSPYCAESDQEGVVECVGKLFPEDSR